MALLICSATPKELAAAVPGLFPASAAIPEMQPIQANIKHGSAIFIATGVGPINAALALGLCFGLMHPTTPGHIPIDAIIYVGLAGAFDLDQTPLCSTWRISSEIWPEYGLNDGNNVTARAFSHPQWERKGYDPVYERIELANIDAIPNAKKKGDPWPDCEALTVAGVTASFARRNALWDAWHIPLENMEGFAAAYAAARAEIPLVEIRAVSNKVGPRGKNEKDFDGALASLSRILPELNLI